MRTRQGGPEDKAAGELLRRVEEVSAIAQTGLNYATGPFDIERYERLRALAAQMLGLLTGVPAPAVGDWLCLDKGYATPKLDVRALVMRGDTLLLVQEKTDGKWTLPGGWCDVDRSPGACAEKEVLEEAGLEVRAVRLLGLFDKRKRGYPFQIPHSFKSFFLCEETGGTLLNGTTETSAAAFVHWKELPPLSPHRITADQIALAVELAKDPTRAAVFD